MHLNYNINLSPCNKLSPCTTPLSKKWIKRSREQLDRFDWKFKYTLPRFPCQKMLEQIFNIGILKLLSQLLRLWTKTQVLRGVPHSEHLYQSDPCFSYKPLSLCRSIYIRISLTRSLFFFHNEPMHLFFLHFFIPLFINSFLNIKSFKCAFALYLAKHSSFWSAFFLLKNQRSNTILIFLYFKNGNGWNQRWLIFFLHFKFWLQMP